MLSVRKLDESKAVAGKYDHLVRPDGMIHRTLFTDPQIFEEEMTKIFGGSWIFLLHEGEIPKPHDFKSITVGRRPVIITRSVDGKIHALLNRCTHRGSLVCVAEHGNANRFRCPFHSWTYGIDGELLAVTFPDGYGPAFDKKAHNLGKLPRVESYRGFVFGSLNPNVEPLLEWLGPARPVLDWTIDREQIGARGITVTPGSKHIVEANWKFQCDNNNDAYHIPFLHFSTAKMNQERYGLGKGLDHLSGDISPMRCQDLGNGHKFLDQRPGIVSSWERTRPVPGRESDASALVDKFGKDEANKYLELVGRPGINLILYPNLFINGHGTFSVYEPVSVDRTYVRYYGSAGNDMPEEIGRLRLRFAEDFNNLGVPDDNEAMQRAQQALTFIPEMEWLDYSRGLGTDREKPEADGVITGNLMDETHLRGSYRRWKELMNSEVQLSVA